MATSKGNKLLCIFLSFVMLTACHLKLSEKEIATAKKKCNEVGIYEEGIFIDFSGFKKSQIGEEITTINRDSLGNTIRTLRDTLRVIESDPEDCTILYKYNQPFHLNSTLEITFGKERYVLSRFILKPKIVTAGIGRRIIIGCMLDSVTVNGKSYTGNVPDHRIIEVRKTDSL